MDKQKEDLLKSLDLLSKLVELIVINFEIPRMIQDDIDEKKATKQEIIQILKKKLMEEIRNG